MKYQEELEIKKQERKRFYFFLATTLILVIINITIFAIGIFILNNEPFLQNDQEEITELKVLCDECELDYDAKKISDKENNTLFKIPEDDGKDLEGDIRFIYNSELPNSYTIYEFTYAEPVIYISNDPFLNSMICNNYSPREFYEKDFCLKLLQLANE